MPHQRFVEIDSPPSLQLNEHSDREEKPISPVGGTKSFTRVDTWRGGDLYCTKKPETKDPPCAVGFPADFVWILLQEAKILSVHGDGLSTRKTRPATTILVTIGLQLWSQLQVRIDQHGQQLHTPHSLEMHDDEVEKNRHTVCPNVCTRVNHFENSLNTTTCRLVRCLLHINLQQLFFLISQKTLKISYINFHVSIHPR